MSMTLTAVKKHADYILKTPFLRKVFLPTSKVFNELSGYRQMGLRLDDLLAEENPNMQKAISRLSQDELYARNYRMLTAHQLSLSQSILPDSKVLKLEDDVPYLTPLLLEAEAEAMEKEELNNVKFSK